MTDGDVRVSRRRALTRAIAVGSARPLPAALGEVTGMANGDVRVSRRRALTRTRSEGPVRPLPCCARERWLMEREPAVFASLDRRLISVTPPT